MNYKNKYLKYKKKYNILKNLFGGSKLGKIIQFKDSDNHILLEFSSEINETLGTIKQQISEEYKIDTNNILFTNQEHNIRYKDFLTLSDIKNDNVLVYFLKELNFSIKLNGDTYQDILNITTYSNQKLEGIFEIPIVKQYFENQNIKIYDLKIYDENNQNINDLTPIQLGDYKNLYIKDKSTFNQHNLLRDEEEKVQQNIVKKKSSKRAKSTSATRAKSESIERLKGFISGIHESEKMKETINEVEKEAVEIDKKDVEELEFNINKIGKKIEKVEEVIKKYDKSISEEKTPAEIYKLISKRDDYKNVLKDLQDRYISNMKNLMNLKQIILKYI